MSLRRPSALLLSCAALAPGAGALAAAVLLHPQDPEHARHLRQGHGLGDGHAGGGGLGALPPGLEDFGSWRLAPEELEGCRGAFSALPEGRRPKEGTGGAVELLLHVDRIYVLCMDCAAVRVPRQWADRTTLVSGQESDRCLGINRTSEGAHWTKVTMAHKLVAADARSRGARAVAVLEEDFRFNHQDAFTGSDAAAVAGFLETGDWGVLRLSYYPADTYTEEMSCKPECVCEEEALTAGRVCKLSSSASCRGLHSSAAYILSNRSFDSLNRLPGEIDVDILPSLKCALLVPPPFHQAVYGELKRNPLFRSKCVVSGGGGGDRGGQRRFG